MIKKHIFIIATIIISNITESYSQHHLFDTCCYYFINKDANIINTYNSTLYNPVFEKFTTLGLKGEGKVNIVHIGDSHIQADFLSGNFRKYLQTFFLGSQSGRGFIFPYKVAKTNNPLSYRVISKGSWESCKNIDHNFKCDLGLSGIAVITNEANAEISIDISDNTHKGYDFNRLMVFHKFGKNEFTPHIATAISSTPFPHKGYTLFTFEKSRERVTLQLTQIDSLQNSFSLYGFNFDSEDPGIIYHTIGVNGAKVESYLKCKYFVPHLNALEPDWVIVSLGTNDVYTNVFKADRFSYQLDELIKNIKSAAPNAVILFTTPGDHLMKRRYKNPNLAVINSIIKGKAEEHKQSVWDLYSVMGGDSSSMVWKHYNLGHTDYLHFTKQGYLLQAQLLFEAFLKSYDKYLEKNFLQREE